MGRQTRPNKVDQFGKGKVTPVQIAYIVDQYLPENHFTQTRTSFRSEASSLISKTPLHEGPKGLLSLATIIDEYVSMKEEKLALEMEKFRVQSLLQGMQNVMNAYNASTTASLSASSLPALPPSGQHPDLQHVSPPGQILNVSKAPTSFTMEMAVNSSSKKRQASTMATRAPTNPKKSRSRIPQTLQNNGNQHHSAQDSSPVEHSSSTNSRNRNTPQDFASNCTIVSTKTVIVSPYKQSTYYSVEKHCGSSCSPDKSELQKSINSDRVKGRLDFDSADETTANESLTFELDDGDFLNLDLPVLDFDIADLLSDFGIILVYIVKTFES